MSQFAMRSGVLVCAVVTWCAVTATVFALRLAGPEELALMSGVSLTVAALGGGAACLWRGTSAREPRTRAAWRLLGCGVASWGLGQIVTSVYELVLEKDVPFPSLADLGYLIAVPLIGAGLLHLAAPTSHLTTRLRAVLDGLLVSTAVLLVSWVSVLGPVARSSTDGLVDKIILLAYPAGDIIIVTLLAHVILRVRATGVRPAVPLGLISFALVCLVIADSGYAYLTLTDRYASGSVIDAGWLCCFTAMIVAAVRSVRRPEEEPSPETRPLGMLLPYIVILFAIIMSVTITETSHGRRDPFTAWIRSFLIVLMVIRQVLALQENSRLTRQLEKRVEERTAELKLSQERFRALVEHSSDVVSLVGLDGAIFYQSESSVRVFGHSSQELLGTRFIDLLDDPSRVLFASTLLEVAQTPLRVAVVELRLMHGDQAWRQVETTITNLLEEPSVGGLVLNSRDVSERRQLEGQLLHQAFHDSLTALANRALFNDRVSHALQRRTDSRQRVAVLFLDLDGFKEVNDSLGHAAGDRLLIEVAERLKRCVRPGDTIARLGGDEFAVLVEDSTSEVEPITVAERIQGVMNEAIMIDDRSLFIQASIGIASAEAGMRDAEQLIRNADLAMYRAKDLRDGEFALYDPTMHSSLVDKLELEADLRKAVRAEELKVYYQPTYTLDAGQFVGVEALVRWHHVERGEVPPDVFIPLAEQTGLIHELGRFVLQEACRQTAEWRDAAPDQPLTVGVNISGRQLQRQGFTDEVRQILEDSGLPPNLLVLEMTESVLMNDTDGSAYSLGLLKEMGIKVAIDDFGTGYSSLSYLHRFPVDILKIDRSFVERLSGTDAQESLVHSIVQLGQTLQLETIAEGIEDHGQLLTLRRLGCVMAQGFHFGRPGPPETINQLLAESASPYTDVPGQRTATDEESDAARLP